VLSGHGDAEEQFLEIISCPVMAEVERMTLQSMCTVADEHSYIEEKE
jgi:hypothetical protein